MIWGLTIQSHFLQTLLTRLRGLDPRSELLGKLVLVFGMAAGFTVVIAAVAWISFKEVVGTQARIVDEAIPTMEAVQSLSINIARIAALVEQLPLVSNLEEVDRVSNALGDHLTEMRKTLDRFDHHGVDAQQSEQLRMTSQAIDRNVHEQFVLTRSRIETENTELTAFSHQREAVKALLGIAESLVSNASATTTSNIANVYRLIDKASRREVLFDSMDRLIEVDIDAMERMSEFQLLCVRIQTLLDQLQVEQEQRTTRELHDRFSAYLSTLKRRVNDLRDPGLKKISRGHYQTLESTILRGGVFDLRQQILAQRDALQQLRTQGTQLALQLNEQASSMAATGGKAIDSAGRQARSAVDRGLLAFLIVAILLFVALIVTIWFIYHHHLLRRLSGMEKAARALSSGNYDVDIATAGNDPLAPLGRALVQVKENVRERERLEIELKQHQEELEALVERRTAELKRSNLLLENEVADHALARREAEEANKAKNLFLGSLSHELRTPLSGVSGATRLLHETDLNPRQSEYVQMIGYANNTLLEILEDMLSFSRIEAGKIDIKRESFNLKQALEDMLSLQSMPALNKGVALISDIDPAIPAFVAGDRGKLNQLLLNLIGNAIKFTDEGSITVSVAPVGQKSSGTVRLKFSIADTGIGIPEEKIGEVFKPFFQIEDTAHQRHGGAGLGLAICRRIVEAMGGEIMIASQAGQGTCVTFEVEFAPLDVPEPSNSNEMLSVRQTSRPLTVLVVEDDEINRLVCVRYLELLGHFALQAEDGTQALEYLNQAAPPIDTILMDISLPGMSGLEVAETIRTSGSKAWARLPIIIMSAHVSTQASATTIGPGFAAFLGKPFSVNALDKALNGVSAPAIEVFSQTDIPDLNTLLLDTMFLNAELEALGSETLLELLELFRDNLATTLLEIDRDFIEQDWQALGKRVHRLRSAAANLGMGKVIVNTRAIETYALEKSPDSDRLGKSISDLKQNCVNSCEELYDWIHSMRDESIPT